MLNDYALVYLFVYLSVMGAFIYLARRAVSTIMFALMVSVVIGYIIRVPYFSILYVGFVVVISLSVIGLELFNGGSPA